MNCSRPSFACVGLLILHDKPYHEMKQMTIHDRVYLLSNQLYFPGIRMDDFRSSVRMYETSGQHDDGLLSYS